MTEIPLQYWPDPQGDSVLVYSAAECLVFRACWEESGIPAGFVSCLSFQRVRGVRCFPREHSPYLRIQRHYRSAVLNFSDSEMIREHLAYRQRHYPQSLGDSSGLRHFVIEGHDFCHEILAYGFTETAIPAGDIQDPKIRRLLDEA